MLRVAGGAVIRPRPTVGAGGVGTVATLSVSGGHTVVVRSGIHGLFCGRLARPRYGEQSSCWKGEWKRRNQFVDWRWGGCG